MRETFTRVGDGAHHLYEVRKAKGLYHLTQLNDAKGPSMVFKGILALAKFLRRDAGRLGAKLAKEKVIVIRAKLRIPQLPPNEIQAEAARRARNSTIAKKQYYGISLPGRKWRV